MSSVRTSLYTKMPIFFLGIVTMSVCAFVGAIQLDNIKYYETVSVQQISRSNAKREDESFLHQKLDPDPKVYEDDPEYCFAGLGRNFHLKLRKNTLLVFPDAKLINQADDASHVTKDEVFEQCYYHGELLDEESSSVVVSTCGGRLDGFLKDSDGVEYVIAPHPDSEVKHVLYRQSDVVQRNGTAYRCGVNNLQRAHYHDESPSTSRLSLLSKSRHHAKRRSVTAWKYIEVIPVVSNQLYKKFRKIESNHDAALKFIQNKVLQYMNIVDSYYKAIDTRVVVTNLMVLDRTDKGLGVNLGVDASLSHFTKYVQSEVFGKMNLRYDHVPLLTVDDVNWGDTLGLAYVGHMCNIDATSVNKIMLDTPDHQMAHLLAHEMGHSVGLLHTSQCGTGVCQKPPCLMEATQQHAPTKGFSQCLIKKYEDLLQSGKLPCILEYPRKFLESPTCGNGFVEDGEQCDCGSEEECRKQGVLACCNPFNCKLKAGAQCAVGKCCSNCQFKSRSTLCRRKAHPDCDLEEYCTGNSEHCPENTYRHAGTPCANGASYCFLDECKTLDEQCKKLWGPTGGKAHDTCYSLNARTPNDPMGNCGKNDAGEFVRCSVEDQFCGKLWCGPANRDVKMRQFPFLGSKARVQEWKITLGSEASTCKGATVEMPMDMADPTLDTTGTKCADESICINHKCVHINTLVRKDCSPPCQNGAVCNNKGICQCPFGSKCRKTGRIHPCDQSNKGGCSQLCIRKDDVAVCGCNAGFKLDTDKVTCNKVCSVKTTGGTAGGACCYFPFTYRDVSYTECTSVGHTKKWCFTKADKSKWGECVAAPSTTTSTCIKTTGGTAGGACCYFPFTYRDVSYTECTSVGHTKIWCFTKADKSKWGECVAATACVKTTGGTAGGACCYFPFTYRDVSYTECTSVGHTKKWCFTKADKSKWGECVAG